MVGGIAFACLAVLCVFVGIVAMRSHGGFEPMSDEEIQAEDEQP